MNDLKLILAVREHEEIYNLNHPLYTNPARRIEVWETIGKKLNSSGNACKDRWMRIRDSYRKALSRRKHQSHLKFKPLRFQKELAFLTPFVDEEEREQLPSLQPSDFLSLEDTFDSSLLETSEDGKGMEKDAEKEVYSTIVREWGSQRSDAESDPLLSFFLSMGRTVKTFPFKEQLRVKEELFRLVNSTEIRLAEDCKDRSGDGCGLKREQYS